MKAPDNTFRYVEPGTERSRFGVLVKRTDKVAVIRPLVPDSQAVRIPLENLREEVKQ